MAHCPFSSAIEPAASGPDHGRVDGATQRPPAAITRENACRTSPDGTVPNRFDPLIEGKGLSAASTVSSEAAAPGPGHATNQGLYPLVDLPASRTAEGGRGQPVPPRLAAPPRRRMRPPAKSCTDSGVASAPDRLATPGPATVPGSAGTTPLLHAVAPNADPSRAALERAERAATPSLHRVGKGLGGEAARRPSTQVEPQRPEEAADPAAPSGAVRAALPGASAGRLAAEMVHGTAVVWLGRGLLLLGPSGSGKSDLALRLIDAGGRLVADDLVRVAVSANRPMAFAPGVPGLIELRGHGIFRLPALPEAAIDYVVYLERAEATGDRLPAPREMVLAGCRLPAIRLDPFAASALARLRLLLTGERVY